MEVHHHLHEIRQVKTPLRAKRCLISRELAIFWKNSALAAISLMRPKRSHRPRQTMKISIACMPSCSTTLRWKMIRFPRDPTDFVPRGVKLATKACELSSYKNATFVRTLADACELAGDKDAAARARDVLKGASGASRQRNDAAIIGPIIASARSL